MFQGLACARWLHQPCAPEDHDRRADTLLCLYQFRLEQLQPKAQGAQFVALEKVDVVISRDIGG
ncbi:hypothetical protein NSND_61782 [Nitrospira sp. ND1]|nr:hypothetical protein NSND_61782 [Nitrospira sp. ND1]